MTYLLTIMADPSPTISTDLKTPLAVVKATIKCERVNESIQLKQKTCVFMLQLRTAYWCNFVMLTCFEARNIFEISLWVQYSFTSYKKARILVYTYCNFTTNNFRLITIIFI